MFDSPMVIPYNHNNQSNAFPEMVCRYHMRLCICASLCAYALREWQCNGGQAGPNCECPEENRQ